MRGGLDRRINWRGFHRRNAEEEEEEEEEKVCDCLMNEWLDEQDSLCKNDTGEADSFHLSLSLSLSLSCRGTIKEPETAATRRRPH